MITRSIQYATAFVVAAVSGTVTPARGAHAQSAPTASRAVAPLTATQQRAALSNPASPFWRTRAPDTSAVAMETSRGTVTIELIRAWAPHGVDRFYNLARAGYYDDTRFYRVLPFYIAQFGLAANPTVGRLWRPRLLRPDSARVPNSRGTIAFAQRTPRDRSVDVFINLRDNVELDSLDFTPLGRVVQGLDVADSIHAGYGELPSMPAPLGNPTRFYGETNRYLDKEFPKLDRIIRITVVPR